MEKQQVELNYSRLEQMDITKGIGILSVIAGHGVVSGVSQNFIYSYHMPLFFLISGYFIKPFNKNSVKIAAGRLLKPYFFTAILIILIKTLTALVNLSPNDALTVFFEWSLAALYGSGAKNNYLFDVNQYMGAIWFLWALFFSVLIISILMRIKNAILWVVMIFYIGYKTSKLVWLPFSIQAGMTMSALVWIGYKVKQNNLLNKYIPLYIILLMLVSWVFCIFNGKLIVASNSYKLGVVDLMGGVFGSFFIYKTSIFIEARLRLLSSALMFFGSNSLIILCFHLVELNTFPWPLMKSTILHYSLSWVVIIKISWVCIAVILVKKSVLLRSVFNVKNHDYSSKYIINNDC